MVLVDELDQVQCGPLCILLVVLTPEILTTNRQRCWLLLLIKLLGLVLYPEIQVLEQRLLAVHLFQLEETRKVTLYSRMQPFEGVLFASVDARHYQRVVLLVEVVNHFYLSVLA